MSNSCRVFAVLVGICLGFDRPQAVVGAPAVAVVPERWTPPKERRGPIDFALAAQADAWLRHGTLGDPSFDSFQHSAANPIVRGKPPFTWPVNGFLMEDPKSGFWYVYVGYYLTGYDVGPGKPPLHCRVHRSKDHGKTWEDLGPIFNDAKFRFEGHSHPANIAPDATVVFANGRYHLAYDFATDNSVWPTMHNPPKDADNGCAYSWSERPEGPFHRAKRPIIVTSEMSKRFALGKKYNRPYGASIVRRKNDFLVLMSADSGDSFGWGFIGMTAADPIGPWSDPTMLLSAEGDEFYPSTAESFPAMVHEGYVYALISSVAVNRNLQIIYRAAIEEAHRPEAWQLYQYGTAWHSEPVPNEGVGIWGQTYTGFVDRGGQYQVMFPSRERETNLGTINLAVRPWVEPLRARGFVLSGHSGPSLTLLRCAWQQFQLKADVALRGGTARIVWAHQAPLGPDRHAADATVPEASLTRYQGLELSAKEWRVVNVDAEGRTSALASGPLEASASRAIEIDRQKDGRLHVVIDGKVRWDGKLPPAEGPIGLLVEPWTNVSVSRFELTGPFKPALLPWTYIEALTGAAVFMTDWDVVQSPQYRFGVGALRKTPGGRVKWNFRGRGFRLWSPLGPEFGRCELLLDGRKLADLNLHAEKQQPSKIVYTCEDAGDGYHAAVLQSVEGRLVVDSLDAVN
jgi:hypothetical protein